MTLFDIFCRYKKDTRILSIIHLDNFTRLYEEIIVDISLILILSTM